MQCPKCQTELPDGAKFCLECGHSLSDKEEVIRPRPAAEGERLGVRPNLSSTYFEVGKRLLKPDSKYKQINGIDANGYLERVGKLFEEMGLERDLDDLERLKAECGL